MSKPELSQDRRGMEMTKKSPRSCQPKRESEMVVEVELQEPVVMAAGIAVLVAVAL
jgi:hypothetical protein